MSDKTINYILNSLRAPLTPEEINSISQKVTQFQQMTPAERELLKNERDALRWKLLNPHKDNDGQSRF